MHQPTGIKSKILTGLSASLPFIVLFVFAPVWLFERHASALNLRLSSAVYCAAVGVALTILIIAVFAKMRDDRQHIAALMALVGLVFWGCHYLDPTTWNLNSPTNLLSKSPAANLAQAALIAALIIGWMRVPCRTRVLIGAALSVTGFAVGVLLFWNLEPRRNVAQVAATTVDRPNVYHFLFDGFATPAFASTLNSEVATDLAGFTYYRRNRSNYLATDASLPSLLSGNFFTGGDFDAFQRQAREGGVRAALKAQGYQVTIYSPDRNRFWYFAGDDNVITNQDLARAKFDPSGAISLAQMSIVTCLPSLFRKPALSLLRFIVPDSGYRKYKRYSVDLIDRFLADEVNRSKKGQYVYVHILLPHPPYRYDEYCKLQHKGPTYQTQARCAVLLMTRIARQLRSLDHFNQSLILFHADHGFDRARSGLDSGEANLPASVSAAIVRSGEQFTPQEAIERSQALLLVKPAGVARHPLTVSDAPTQLVDVAATIADAAGLKLTFEHAVPVHNLSAITSRTWHLFTGLEKQGGLFMPSRDGAGIAHIAQTSDGHWQVRPYIGVRSRGCTPRLLILDPSPQRSCR